MLISLQLFVQGDDLLPQSITEQLGISPGHAYAMGDKWTTGQGAIRLRPTGLWKWGISKEHDDPDLTLIVKDFCQAIVHQAGNISEIPGVERAWIDIFICKEIAEGESSDVAFNLDSASLKELSKLNLPMEFTTGIVKAEN